MPTTDSIVHFLWNVLWRAGLAVALYLLARRLAPWARHRLDGMLKRTKLTSAINRLALNALYYGIWAITIMTILGLIGVPVNAILASAGVIVVILGIALQQSLRDLAATVNFLLFAPFVIGETIETNGTTGTVLEIQPLTTVILRGDNKTVVLPNGQIQQNGLINYSRQGILRVDMIFGLSYGEDIGKARGAAMQVLSADPRVLNDPAPMIVVLDLGESSVNLGVRPFVKASDYWQAQWDLTERIKQAFDAAGITIPFPQRDIHVITPPADNPRPAA
ncbi:MAG: mechanosensitive ion channel [Caldilinea sp.]|nr:mechanosensitive ion channel [Caldilinea sp.]MCB0059289.1 mechanosensitive ion channel [Caldilineaceae bacterium]MCB0041221.1 mechanosensitive ion channel [Caldilinea sp.]MCB0148856.1 mechanosensitive ion channel [Caldilineaceae bacterium]MCB9120159.1 mechanosensitive ion channel [Caldilineaceae bacterium]